MHMFEHSNILFLTGKSFVENFDYLDILKIYSHSACCKLMIALSVNEKIILRSLNQLISLYK